MDKPYPQLTCVNCGEVKSALHFPKMSGPYKKFKVYDPRRYNKQCKRCIKPALPGQSRDEVKEPKIRHKAKGGHAACKKRWAKPPKEKLTLNEQRRKRRRETRIKSMWYLAEKGCEECGVRDPRVLEYDHKEPSEKKRNIGRLIVDGFSWSSRVLRTEIRKCRVLCSNCHRKHTIEQQGYYSHEELQRTLGEIAARYKFEL